MALRILFATDHIHFPQGGGGGERNTHELCLMLKQVGACPAVMCSLVGDTSWLSWSNRLRRHLRPGHRFPVDHGCGYPVFRGWQEDGAKEIKARFRPDVVVVQSTHPDKLLNSFTACGVPVLLYVHEVEDIAHLASLANQLVPVLANSDFTARRLSEQCGLVAETVLPLVDPRHYRTQARPERVLFVNTVPRKGLEIALAIAERRTDIGFDFVTSWILSPTQRSALEKRASDAGNVVLHAPTRNMRPLYARARILLAPSLWEETWGRVATEAHINGIPVLGSDQGGLPQAIGPGGIVVAADAPIEAWLEGLSRIWDDPATYAEYSRAARAYAGRPEIQPGEIAVRLHELLVQVVAGTVRAT